ncbi:radical SAM protein, partial [Streptomyces solincola]|uniref:radical SAM protein n=1 Tax=Streptomyces solincola TaxID=2100817 RepID=UPI002159303B
MRWDHLNDDSAASAADPALFGADAVVTRTFDTPEFRGITFHEVRARSIVNRVPGASRMPFEWTVNPYRGCSHACVYCFARRTHGYLDLDTGLDFDSQIVVKVNAPELLRRKLASAGWQGAHIAMGTNVDCYQRAEGRYRLMPGIISALRDHANPFSILTKGTLVLRDLPLLTRAAEVTDVGVSVSVGFTDTELWRTVEPGTPAPERRLEVVRRFAEQGIGCAVLMAPVLPFLSDRPGVGDRPDGGAELLGAVGEEREDRGHQHRAADALLGEPADHLQAAFRRRGAGLHGAPQLGVGEAHRDGDADVGHLGGPGQHRQI